LISGAGHEHQNIFLPFPSREDLLSLERMIDRNKLDENHVNGLVSVGAVELNRQRRGD
jgi:hypothetical protein